MLRKLAGILLLVATAYGGEKDYSGPTSLGPFKFGSNYSDAVQVSGALFKKLGSHAKRASKLGPYCYASTDGKTFLYITTEDSDPGIIDQVFLSDFPNSKHFPVQATPEDLRSWETSEKIGIGSTKEEISKAYGKPSSQHHPDKSGSISMLKGFKEGDKIPPIGTISMAYFGDLASDLRTAEFGIRDGKVSYIWLSDSE